MAVLTKRLPVVVLWISFTVIWLILMSTLGMWLGFLLGQGDLTHEQMRRILFVFSPLMPFYKPPLSVPVGFLIFTGILCNVTWLFSTRVKLTNISVVRRAIAFIFPWGTFTLLSMLVAAAYVKPIGYDLIMQIDGWVETPEYREYLHPGGLKMIGWVLLLLPSYAIIRYWIKIVGEYRSDPVLQEWFENYKFQWKWLGRFGDERANVMPDIVLALEADTKTPVVLTGDSRQLGTMLIGPPGSGKTSLKIIKAFRQDLGHLQRAINAFPGYVKKYGYGTPEFQKAWGSHLIGSIIVEPAKDLCDSAYELALDHGIPEEFIVYLDPSNPKTPGFNCMVGPLSQVAETLTAVLDSMSESSDDFFRQSCRTVLKAYVYLLKFIKKNECALLDLDQMYQDPRYTADLLEELEQRLPDPAIIANMSTDRQIFWMLARRTVQWFRNDGIEPEKTREGMFVRYSDGPHKGKIKYTDKQFEFTRTTRNLIADLLQNPYCARVLLGKNSVDLDKLMSRGGILLCNTANGELGDVSSPFGKLVYMSVQNAVFRRKGTEKTRPLVSSYADEFLEYMNSKFLRLTSQGRKYKYAPLVATQTLSQFDIELGRGFVDGMMGTIRNYIVYGGVGKYDAEKLSEIFGTTVVDEFSFRESITPENMNNPNYTFAETTTRKEMELVTSDSIMYNKFKYSFIRLVVEGSTQKAIKAMGDFVDFGSADKWKKALKTDALDAFMEHWRIPVKEDEHFDMDWIDDSAESKDDAEKGIQFPGENQGQSATRTSTSSGPSSEDEVAAATESEEVHRKADYIGQTTFKNIPKEDTPRRRFADIELVGGPRQTSAAIVSPTPAPESESSSHREVDIPPVPKTEATEGKEIKLSAATSPPEIAEPKVLPSSEPGPMLQASALLFGAPAPKNEESMHRSILPDEQAENVLAEPIVPMPSEETEKKDSTMKKEGSQGISNSNRDEEINAARRGKPKNQDPPPMEKYKVAEPPKNSQFMKMLEQQAKKNK
ncbi:type IV secretory system conjugative DNA transfer family protein [Paenibacillus allorhizosphaerae]|uniref:TraD/TraG TraM recognition site domain-containing protein n=1 Tax=Paenibacillus allorhizosphaerae TaxID=2849866 RepID=A0ABM8VNA2_9BACL|nr:TraM recognition domain-containing protein [Paenibacillus allorhizosphaerae]CAG7651199.1 hypothetical protein PAECIP111802_04903 [Paenibacillus allorhizosphaerae]